MNGSTLMYPLSIDSLKRNLSTRFRNYVFDTTNAAICTSAVPYQLLAVNMSKYVEQLSELLTEARASQFVFLC